MSYRYLNLRDEWPLFTMDGLVIGTAGELRLAPRPALPPSGAAQLAAALAGPATAGVDRGGNVYLADTAGNRILRVGCDGEAGPLPCLSGLSAPRGVLVGPRNRLYIADSGNDRVVLLDVRTGQLRGTWAPLPDPRDLAADAAGRIYVALAQRVDACDADGQVDPGFWTTVSQQSRVPADPRWLAVTLVDGEERLLVGEAGTAVLVYRTDGTFDGPATDRWLDLPASFLGGTVFDSTVFDGTVFSTTLLVADPLGVRLLGFDAAGAWLGPVAGDPGAAGLALDCRGGLLTRASTGAGYLRSGTFLAGPYTVGDEPTRWHRLRFTADPLPPGHRVQLYTYTSAAPAPPAFDPSTVDPATAGQVPLTPTGQWRAAPPDALDLVVLHEPAQYLWIAGAVHADGTTSPVLHQARLGFDHEPYLRYLPAPYREGPRSGFLERSLDLLESFLADTGAAIDDLPRLFDAASAPDPPWLDWLSTWLGYRLRDGWDEATRREALAGAFAAYHLRGTPAGLRAVVERYTGVTIQIDEPALRGAVWALGETSVLGFDTALPAGSASGAVLGTTAVADQSYLSTGAEPGAELTADLAHRFCVRVPAGTAEAEVRAVLDREKPAHTSYQLCAVGPGRVGRQARVGVDAYVAGPPPLVPGTSGQLGWDAVLPPGPTEPRVGRTVLL